MRGVLVDWLNEVHLQFTLVQETFFLAVALIDRYLQTVTSTTRPNLQLVGVTALFLAAKYEELYPPEINDFVYITDDTYNKKQILEMERHMIGKLDFKLGRPLPIHFLRRFAKAAHSGEFTDVVYRMAKYFIELAAVDYSMAHYLPSEVSSTTTRTRDSRCWCGWLRHNHLRLIFYIQVAAASLLLALRIVCIKPVWNTTLQYYTEYTEAELEPIVRALALVVRDATHSKLRAVFTKYSKAKLGQISMHPQLIGSKVLERIIDGRFAETDAPKAAYR